MKCSITVLTTINPIYEGDNFFLHPKVIPISLKLGKDTQKRYQICARNLFSYFFPTKTKIINKSRDLPMTSLWNSTSILRSNSHKIKSAITLLKNDI